MYKLDRYYPELRKPEPEPFKIKLGVVFSRKDDTDTPYILVCNSTGLQLKNLKDPRCYWNNVTTPTYWGHTELSFANIKPVFGTDDYSVWSVWTAQEVADWFLKNYAGEKS